MSFGVIYKATNKINGKVYIGQTIENLKTRIIKHYNSANYRRDNYHFHNALRKYDRKDFEWEIIDECDDKESMDDLEYHYIMQYDSLKNGYNSTLGGEGVHGHSHSKETRKKMSISARNRTDIRTGYIASKETRKKMSLSGKKRLMPPMSDECRLKMSLIKMGKKHSEETKRKISLAVAERGNGGHKVSVVVLPNNKSLIVNNVNKFCRVHSHLNLSPNCLRRCALDSYTQKHHKHFKCEDYDSDKHCNLSSWGGSIEWR